MASDLRFSYASLYGRSHNQPVDYWDQDCAWRVHMGLGFIKKKNGGHMASDLGLSYSGLYKRSVIDPVTFIFKLEGTFGISTPLPS